MLMSLLSNPKTLYTAGIIFLSGTALGLTFWPRQLDAEVRDPYRALFFDVEYAISGNKMQIDTDDESDDGYVIYAGIRAPHGNERMAKKAFQRNGELVNGKRIRLRFGKKKHDSEGRMLAYVFSDSEFVNETLVRDGLAYVRLTDENHRYEKRLLEAQASARRYRRGIWKSRSRTREKRYMADPKYGNFHRFSCEECSKIPPDRLKIYRSADKAIETGLAPCSQCKP